MFNSLRSIVILCGIITVILAVSNPNKKSHVEKIKDKFCVDNPITCVVIGDRGNHLIAYESYLLFSRSIINDEVASFGILGVVVARDLEINLI